MSTDHTHRELTTAGSAPELAISESNFPTSPDSLSEDVALAQLKSRDLTAAQIEEISRDASLMKSRKVRLALAAHPHSPRRLGLHLIREFCTFELMRFALLPAVTADRKRLADELVVSRIASITLGERISLARRSSSRVAAALLLDKKAQVWRLALDNGRLNEAGIIKALQHAQVSPAFVQAVCRHNKWSLRREVRVALLQNPHTPLARALEFARGIPSAQLRDILYASRMPEKNKAYLHQAIDIRR